MTLCRLLLRPLRRYSSSSSNPYPFHSPFPNVQTSTPTPPIHNSHQPINPQFPNPSSATTHQNPTPSTVDASNQYYNPQFPPPSQATSNHHYNHQYPPTNHHYNFQSTPNYNYNPQYSTANTASAASLPPNYNSQSSTPPQTPSFSVPSSISTSQTTTAPFVPQRSYGFSSAEEAAAERRRRKRRLRMEPPLYALRSNPQTNTVRDANNPDKPRLPDSTSALVGNRLNLHNRVQSLIRAGDLDSASYVARQSVFQSVRPTVFTCNAIIAAMYRGKRYSDAKALFQYFFRQFNIIPNIVSYNNLIVSHCESNEIEDAMKVYEYILENAPYSPSAVTYRHLTKGLIDAHRLDDAVSLLREMLNKGHGADSLVFNNVILGFLNLGNLEKANELFDELKERCTVYDGVVNATFMDWFFNQGRPKEAMESYRDLMDRNYRMVPATRNVLLETLLKHGKKKEAWDLFHYMLDDHTPPTFQAVNSDTVNMMVNECFKEGNIEEAMDVFKRSGTSPKSKPFQMDVGGFNNMMARLCELEMMEEAEQYYKQLCSKSLPLDVNAYRTLIDAYIKVDRVDNMIEKFSKMVEAGLRVIPPYANKWFGYLVEKGMASECLPLISKMVNREPKPDVTTYDVVIRGLVQEGNYDATFSLLEEMMNHGIGVTASLKEFLLDVFEKHGRRIEIENMLNGSLNAFPAQRPYQGPNGLPRVAKPPEIAGQRGINQFSGQTHHHHMSTHPHLAEQGFRNQPMPWQITYSSPTSYANQFAEQKSPPFMSNPPTSFQTGVSSPTSYPNHFAEQTPQPQMAQHNYPTSDPEAEFPRVAGQNDV